MRERNRRRSGAPVPKLEAYVGGNGLAELGGLLGEYGLTGAVAVVTDETVGTLYAGKLCAALAAAGFRAAEYRLPCGPAGKSLAAQTGLLEWLAAQQFGPADTILAFGGSSVCDAAGFAAACYLGGVALVRMPTTLLAALERGAGDEASLDLPQGPRLLRARCAPKFVACDTDLLTSLDAAALSAGVATAIQYAMLGSPALLGMLSGDGEGGDTLERVILACMGIRAGLLAGEGGERDAHLQLDFGHDFGDALLRLGGGALSRGQALAAGMALVTRAAVREGISEEDCCTPLLRALAHNHLPGGCRLSAAELCAAVVTPADRARGLKALVLPLAVGRCALYPVPLDHFEAFVRAGLME